MKLSFRKLFASLVAIFSFSCAWSQCDFTEVAIESSTGGWGYEMSWEILNENDEVVASFQGVNDDETSSQDICLEDGCYVFIAEDSYGDGWNGGSVQLDIPGEFIDYSLDQGSGEAFAFGINTEGCIVEIPGCTDPDAINYNPLANIDDGSCTDIQGILDEQSITQFINSGPTSNRINWAIQNRGMPNPNDEFQSEEEFLGLFEDAAAGPFTVGHPLSSEPYTQYRDFFNLYAWWWEDAPSTETGWSWQLLKGMRDLYFLPWEDDEHGWATLFSTSRWGGGGGAGVQPDTRTGDGLMYGMDWETFLHEFGHTMPQVPDEYTASGEWSGGQCWEGANTTGWTIRDSIPWRNWIVPGTPLPTPYIEENMETIGAFEGALTNYFGCHRSTARGCYMGAGGFGEEFGQELCPPCRQRVICHLYKYVDVIENPMPVEQEIEINGPQTLSFSADIIKPEPNTQEYKWLLNGVIIAEGVEELEVNFGNCDSYTLALEVNDLTDWVRYDEHFDNIYPKPFESHTWIIDNTQVDEYELSANAIASNMDCTGAENGSVEFEIEGMGTPSVFYEGLEIANPHENLSANDYNYWIVDDNGCGVQIEATVAKDPIFDYHVCSGEVDGFWYAGVITEDFDSEDLEYLWSTGDTGLDLIHEEPGEYWVEITTPDGCTVHEDLNFVSPSTELLVTAFSLPSASEENTGRIDLSITGGSLPYKVEWYDNPWKDLTFPDDNFIDQSGWNFDHFPEYAFDDNLDTKWLHFVNSNAWIEFEFSGGETIRQYAITSGDDVEERDPKDWVIEGSMNGSDWTILDSRADEDFPERKLRRAFPLDNELAYVYYRLWVQANNGDESIQIQELEFIGAGTDGGEYNPLFDDVTSRTELAPGDYTYWVQDANSDCAFEDVAIGMVESYVLEGITVVQDGPCRVKIESPNPEYDYYWLSDEQGSEILDIGNDFVPPQAGNFWVAAVNSDNEGMSTNRPGFAVTMPESPVIEEVSEGILGVTNLDSDLIYRWYTEDCGGVPIHEGDSYTPGNEAIDLFVSSWWVEEFPAPIDPLTVSGMVARIDAADLDGDGAMDDPRPESSSLYEWNFTPGPEWSDGSWFAFRGNYQNGLGVADFATMWLQCFEGGIQGYKSVLMAYQENNLSFEGTAPFYNLSDAIPYSENPEQQLFSNDAPDYTLNGDTYWNGEDVNPLSTPNSLEFSVLGQTFTQEIGWTDCSDTHWEGMVGEMLFYDSELSTENMIGISEFLRKKWISTADLESVRTPVSWDGTSIGIDEVLIGDESLLIIRPNPATANSTAEIYLPGNQKATVTLCNVTGQIIARTEISGERNFVALGSWISALQSGIYLLVVESDQGVRLVKRILR